MRIVSFDGANINDGATFRATFDYSFHAPSQQAQVVTAGNRPSVSSVSPNPRQLTLFVMILDASNLDTHRRTLHKLFDQSDDSLHTLVVDGDDGQGNRYWNVIVQAFDQVPTFGGLTFAATLLIDKDNRPRRVNRTFNTESVTSSGQQWIVNNSAGDLEAYPIIKVTPIQDNASQWGKKRFLRIRWNAELSARNYPVDVLDQYATSALVSAGDMQANGDDLRIVVDDVLVDFWLVNPNTVATEAWVNLDFDIYPDLTLKTGFADVDSVTELAVNEDISAFPESGIVVITDEIFSYTGRNLSQRKFTGVTRATRGSSAATHVADDTVWLCQHDIWMLYDNPSAAAHVPDDRHKPVFDLSSSTNATWDYNEFGEPRISQRAARWTFTEVEGATEHIGYYTGSQVTYVSPATHLGILMSRLYSVSNLARWYLTNPCGIEQAQFSGEKFADHVGHFNAGIQMWNHGPAGPLRAGNLISAPASDSTWESYNETLSDPHEFSWDPPYTELQFELWTAAGSTPADPSSTEVRVDASDVTLTLRSDLVPTFQVMPEINNYTLQATIRNETTGDEIRLDMEIELNDTVIIDTDTKTVTLESDGRSLYRGLSLPGDSARREWLPLAQGDNTITYTETGVVEVEVEFEWERRLVF